MQDRERLQHQVVASAQVRALVLEDRAELGRREAGQGRAGHDDARAAHAGHAVGHRHVMVEDRDSPVHLCDQVDSLAVQTSHPAQRGAGAVPAQQEPGQHDHGDRSREAGHDDVGGAGRVLPEVRGHQRQPGTERGEDGGQRGALPEQHRGGRRTTEPGPAREHPRQWTGQQHGEHAEHDRGRHRRHPVRPGRRGRVAGPRGPRRWPPPRTRPGPARGRRACLRAPRA